MNKIRKTIFITYAVGAGLYLAVYVMIAFAAEVPVPVASKTLPDAVWIALITMIGGTIATIVSAFVQIWNGRTVRQAAKGIDGAKVDIVKAAVAVEDTKKEVSGMHSSLNSKMDALLKAHGELEFIKGRDAERAAVAMKQVENINVSTERGTRIATEAPTLIADAATKAQAVLAVAEMEAKDKLQRARDLLNEARLAVNIEATNSIKEEIKVTEGAIKEEITKTEAEIMGELTRKKDAIKKDN